jgi:hypothetical protein
LTVAFDATFLLYLFVPAEQGGVPLDENGFPVTLVRERVQALVYDLNKAGSKIVVPTPALSEIMVRAGVEAGQRYINIMRKAKVFWIAPFDEKAAVETAIMAGEATKCPSIRAVTDGTYAKIKYDRQIVGIAVSEGATTLYTDDRNQQTFARRHGIKALGIADCLVPDSAAQMTLRLEGAPSAGDNLEG